MGGSTSQQSTISSSEEPAPINPHHSLNKSSTNIADDEIDPAEVSIKASGCWDNHIRLTDCMSNSSSDWRKCQHEVKELAICMRKNNPEHYPTQK